MSPISRVVQGLKRAFLTVALQAMVKTYRSQPGACPGRSTAGLGDGR